jgi:transcriptional regulator with XRE-family HTH domain
MPNIDEGARAWELGLTARAGTAVRARRKTLKLTAVQLAERTKQLGYPITRVAITKIEGNTRAGKLGVAELVTLAEALEASPLELLYPGPPDRRIDYLPGRSASTLDASTWFVGEPDWLVSLRDQLHQLIHALTASGKSVALGTVVRKKDNQ